MLSGHCGHISNRCIQFKPVKLSEPSEKPHSKIVKDPFILLWETQKEEDKARCDAWKDEVQNLLIFVSVILIVNLKFYIRMFQGWSVLSGRHCFYC